MIRQNSGIRKLSENFKSMYLAYLQLTGADLAGQRFDKLTSGNYDSAQSMSSQLILLPIFVYDYVLDFIYLFAISAAEIRRGVRILLAISSASSPITATSKGEQAQPTMPTLLIMHEH